MQKMRLSAKKRKSPHSRKPCGACIEIIKERRTTKTVDIIILPFFDIKYYSQNAQIKRGEFVYYAN